MKPNNRIFLSPPHMGGTEIDYVMQAFNSNYIAPAGPQLNEFEKKFCELTGFRHAVAVSSGTAAMHLALLHLGVGSGDVVLASTLTFIGSVGPVSHLGAELVFVDSDRKSWTMDPEWLRQGIADCKKAGRLPKAVIPTDLYGQSCDVDTIKSVCDPEGIPVIVDSAEALGATCRGRSAGKGTEAAVFSFNGNKIITTSGGGLLAADDPAIIESSRYLSTQARQPLPHYEHLDVGFNYRMSNVVAAIGIGQLEVVPDRVRRKREIFSLYEQALADVPGVQLMPEADWGVCNRWLTVLTIDAGRFGCGYDAVMQRLEQNNIESRPVWKPMHLQPVFAGRRCLGGEVAESLFATGLCLPSGTAMSDEQVQMVAEIVRGCGGS